MQDELDALRVLMRAVRQNEMLAIELGGDTRVFRELQGKLERLQKSMTFRRDWLLDTADEVQRMTELGEDAISEIDATLAQLDIAH